MVNSVLKILTDSSVVFDRTAEDAVKVPGKFDPEKPVLAPYVNHYSSLKTIFTTPLKLPPSFIFIIVVE